MRYELDGLRILQWFSGFRGLGYGFRGCRGFS